MKASDFEKVQGQYACLNAYDPAVFSNKKNGKNCMQNGE